MPSFHFKNAAGNVVRDMEKNHTMAFAASLSYYFVVALFPFLIFLSAVVAYLPVPDFFSQVMGLIARVVPAANMGPLRNLVKDTVLSRHSRLLTFGILFTLWSASSGFTALIDALNTAYDVSETRRYWKTRGLAILLTFSVGCLLVVALGMLLVGSSVGAWLTETFGLRSLWPYIRWAVAIGCTILAVELLYFVAPNVKQRFVSTLPGAVIAVGGWIGLSYLLGIYFQDFSAYSKGYGSLGIALAFSIWLYWSGFVILIGAQFNAELLQEGRGTSALEVKGPAESNLAA
ncbi:MAG TPA: YihY/virulence factor BrkB family protein [Candidatus Sulfotelmatobacter sp.]|nr:YihY/virulence factor BrkB family protein [Candidatus Sulfotelmatobacter sp.]